MRHAIFVFSAAALLAACNSETKTDHAEAKVAGMTTENKPKVNEWVPVDDSTAMKAMMEVGTPGAEHAWLAKSNGNWKAEVRMWMSPDAPPQKSTAQVTNKMVFGGRYQQSMWKGDMMGMPFEGISTTTYDKAQKKWVSTWMDNMSTSMMNMEGTWNEATKTASYRGQMLCPANGKMCEMRESMTFIDDDTQLMEMWGPDMKTGKLFKNMEVKLTRMK